MIQDPENRYIKTILEACDLRDKEVLEIGCGRGRITRDLAGYACRLVAIDPDADAVSAARTTISANNVIFMQVPSGMPVLPEASFDIVIYTLSLHHLPPEQMEESLRAAGRLLRAGGRIIVLEPGDGGSLTEAKERFGAGSGDERPARQAAIRVMEELDGWTRQTTGFRTSFHFDNEADFLSSMLPGLAATSAAFQADVTTFLSRHKCGSGIVLDAGRQLTVLYPIKPF